MLRPARKVSDEFVNFASKSKLPHSVVVHEDNKLIKTPSKKCVACHHEGFPNEEPCSVRRWTAVSSEGPEADFFAPENQEGNEDEEKEGDVQEETDVLLTGGAQENSLIFLRLLWC